LAGSIVRDLIKYAVCKGRYPRLQLELGASVRGTNVFGSNVAIGKDSYIYQSRFGENVRILEHCAVFDTTLEDNTMVYSRSSLSRVRFGAYSYVNEHAMMRGVTAGRFTSIGPHFLCGYGEHPTEFISTSPVFYSTRKQCGVSFAETNRFEEQQETTIGNDVWIGARVFVRDGVRIGNGAVIAAGAVVTGDIPDYAIVGGVPAKVIRYRFPEEVINKLLEIQWWDWNEHKLREAQPLLSQTDINSFLEWTKGT
jgi:chloramphenicol O-acetyltransferase type B